MKKIISIFLAAAALSFSAAAEEETAFKESKASGQGVILRDGCVLWNKADDGKIKWIGGTSKNAASGKTFSVTSEATATLVSSSGESPDTSFYGIEMDGKEFYVLKSQVWVSDSAKPAVMLRGSIICRRPLLSSFMQEVSLTPVTVGAVEGQSVNGFKVFHYYNAKKYIIETVYLPQNEVSESKADLEAVELHAKLKATTDPELKAKLIDTINTSGCSEELVIGF